MSLKEWHVVRISRTGRDGYLQLDNQAAVEGMSKGAYTQLTLTLDLFVGGHRNFDEVAKNANVQKAFKGCIQKVRGTVNMFSTSFLFCFNLKMSHVDIISTKNIRILLFWSCSKCLTICICSEKLNLFRSFTLTIAWLSPVIFKLSLSDRKERTIHFRFASWKRPTTENDCVFRKNVYFQHDLFLRTNLKLEGFRLMNNTGYHWYICAWHVT